MSSPVSTSRPGLTALAALYSLFLIAAPVASETLTVATGDWPPYVSPQLKHYGVTARIVKEAFEAAGDKVVFQFFPWKRTLLMSEEGLADASFPWSHKPEREAHHYYSDSIGRYGYVFFHLKTTSFEWRELSDLRSLKVGGTNSYNYGEDFVSASKDGLFEIEWVHSDELNWRKLLAGRLDIFPSDVEAGYAELRDLFPAEQANRVTHHPHPLKPLTTMHLLFSMEKPESVERLKRFNAGLQQLHAEGKIEQYLRESREGQYRLVSEEVREEGL
ncbi:ABC transporter substrate-binding protein [Hahella sp. HN01]|uniref:substrate-binding periplasmic protein n=1 Tax=Hahella sp. HN01 TaxID=2847262 RepID=UPI001C1EC18D|nr:transporter substrate-binding domain-containing protein [Hahella sp. HN01]MBU6953063.1 transporter substrate-binding domain-containing protein [Hahella sp. HN01]